MCVIKNICVVSDDDDNIIAENVYVNQHTPEFFIGRNVYLADTCDIIGIVTKSYINENGLYIDFCFHNKEIKDLCHTTFPYILYEYCGRSCSDNEMLYDWMLSIVSKDIFDFTIDESSLYCVKRGDPLFVL